MANPTARIFVYRLTFESYLKGLNDEPSVESMKNLADELFDLIDEKLLFLDGKGRSVEADNLTKFGSLNNSNDTKMFERSNILNSFRNILEINFCHVLRN